VNPVGSKLWRCKYRVLGKEKVLSLGAYPDVSLAQAREGVDKARKVLATGGDLRAHHRIDRRALGRIGNRKFKRHMFSGPLGRIRRLRGSAWGSAALVERAPSVGRLAAWPETG